jgi:hypothetical protein
MSSPECDKPKPSKAAPTGPLGLNPRVGWCALLIAAGWFFWDDAPSLNDRTGYGPVKVLVAEIAYALIAVRALIGLILRNRSWGWVAYALLLLAVGPLIIVLVHLGEKR